jgi:hypothetical protein
MAFNVLRLIAVARRLDTELGHEAQAIEVGVLGVARRLRRLRDVFRFDAFDALEDGAQAATRDVAGLFMPVGCSRQDHVRPELPLRVIALDDDEFGVEAFRLTVARALQETVRAGAAGTDVHLNNGDCAVGNDVEAPLSSRLIVVNHD